MFYGKLDRNSATHTNPKPNNCFQSRYKEYKIYVIIISMNVRAGTSVQTRYTTSSSKEGYRPIGYGELGPNS